MAKKRLSSLLLRNTPLLLAVGHRVSFQNKKLKNDKELSSHVGYSIYVLYKDSHSTEIYVSIPSTVTTHYFSVKSLSNWNKRKLE